MKFPIIRTIDDVLPAIEGRKEFSVTNKIEYTIVCYNVAFTDSFDDSIRRECRGLIFDKSGKIIRRPFHKFFNYGEKPDIQPDFSQPHVVYEKLDGSMIAPFIIGKTVLWGTKRGFTEVSAQVVGYVQENPKYINFSRYCIEHGFSPIFEWCSRKQKIVIDYPEDQLILLAIRDMITGVYHSQDDMISLAGDIPVVKEYRIA